MPGLHLVCSALPVGAKWPAPVLVHSPALVRLVEPEYEPSAHGSAALAPSGQYEPATQAAHTCLPSPVWYLPASHLSHAPMPESGWTVPGLHCVWLREPVEQDEPEGHSVHSLFATRPPSLSK